MKFQVFIVPHEDTKLTEGIEHFSSELAAFATRLAKFHSSGPVPLVAVIQSVEESERTGKGLIE